MSADFKDDPRIQTAKGMCIREVASLLGLELTQNGKSAYHPGGRGPGGRSPSINFGVKDCTEVWHSFRDAKGGDVISLVQHFRECGFKDALDWLTGPKPTTIPQRTYAALEERPPEPAFADRVAACTGYYEQLPPLDEFGLGWLLAERGISAETANRFGVRFVDDSITDAALGGAIGATDAEVAVSLGLGKRSADGQRIYGSRRGYWLVIPYIGADGMIGHLQFRRVHRSGKTAQHHEKWRHTNGTVPWPWNLSATSADKVWFVEGAFDGMRLEQEGFAAVGIPGVHWLDDAKSRRLVELMPEGAEGIEAYDCDPAGKKAGPLLVSKMQAAGLRMSTVVWPDWWEGDWCEAMLSDKSPEPTIESCVPNLRLLPTPDPTDDISVSWESTFRVGLKIAASLSADGSGKWRTGYPGLDSRLSVKPGDMVVIAGRPSAGKTHAMMSFAHEAAVAGFSKPAIISVEMSEPQLGNRIACASLGLTSADNLNEEMSIRADMALRRCPDIRLVFSGRHLDDVMSSIRSVVSACDCDVVYVDYLQFIKSNEQSRYESLDLVSKSLKSLFRELGVIGVVGAQLKRGSAGLERQPTIDDIKGCGSIEEDADHILLLDCPNPNAVSEKRLVLAKNKHGEIATFSLLVPYPFGWLAEE
jgi:hypothetical protein